MKTRIIGAILALVLAAVGAFFLITYVHGADARAQLGAQLTDVYIVKTEVPRGTPGDQIKDYVTSDSVPKRNVVPDAVTDLSKLNGLLASADLLPGDQLSSARFASSENLAGSGDIPVPAGMQLLSFSLPADRVVGGQVKAGDHIGLISTTDPAQSGGVHVGYPDPIDPVTRFTFHGVLVTRVQGLVKTSKDGSNGSTGDQQSSTTVMLTIALSANDAARWVWYTEGVAGNYAHMWLTLENAKTSNSGAGPITSGNAG
ncbi:hypothetical protein [Microbacterium capsulatum]|uniref:Flp pilus assembly protein CpaB n=1 Tax=Microbacterium capsulatum TaxID=3041921 RepID=A0ABU0XE58_9MICO|nr:hypothetical protein [Microbacterium sp. ASV81]MDQ4213401.1 hypothetical protein [Microbacterium sp. ASV81]